MEIEDFYIFLGYSLTRIPQWGHSRTLISILERFELTEFFNKNYLSKEDFEVEKEFYSSQKKI
ncbi:MAG: hypothetical protein COZ18_04145 [Flexibacter sp. CG_4_10_14_3_um_filter_32_15]|nr:MAG: hypothetical protein COZ18_04145 [Flexibacter sp. CG_4_10_14_3_um_filter_32_15]